MNDLQPQDAKLDKLEAYMQALPQVAADCQHAFAPGIYIRQVFLKAGSLVMGHRHRQAHLNIMIQGRMTMFHGDGSRSSLIAPVVCVAPPGRKVAYIHEDSVWLNLYATNETDVEKLEAEFLDKTESWEELNESFMFNRDADREDFDSFLFETGFDAPTVRRESENTVDQIPFPQGTYKFKVGRSHIEGKGLIACADIAPGEVIAPARLEGKRTPAGRYTNHAKAPNARMEASRFRDSDDIYLVATRTIGGALGGQDGDEITVDYRDALKLNKRLTQ